MARGEIPFVVLKPVASVTGAQGSETVNIAVSGASVLINIRGGGPATIFGAETGAGTIANPTTTTTEGRIDGWLDEGSYTMTVSGSGIATFSQPFEVNRGDGTSRFAPGSVTTVALADASVTTIKIADANVTTAKIVDANVTTAKIADSNVTTAKLADANVTNAKLATGAVTDAKIAAGSKIPVGTVLNWWRAPGSTDTPPTGFEIADGHSVASGSHDFSVAGAVTLPDLRNTFILGADSTKTDATAGTMADGSANAPGIRGVGGSQAITLTTTTIPSHTHTGSGTTVAGGPSPHNHPVSGSTGASDRGLYHDHGMNYVNQGAASGSGVSITSISVSDSQPKGRVPTRSDPSPDHLHGISLTSGTENQSLSHSHTYSFTTSSVGSGSPHENRPNYYGLLKIIKVKAT